MFALKYSADNLRWDTENKNPDHAAKLHFV